MNFYFEKEDKSKTQTRIHRRSPASLELLYDVDVEGRIRLLRQGLEVGVDRVLGAGSESPLEQTLEAGQAVRVVGQAEVAVFDRRSLISSR